MKLGDSNDALFPAKTKDDNGDQKCTIDLGVAIKKQIVNNTEQTEQNVDLSTFDKFCVYLMHNCTADNDISSITIKKVYVHHKTHTGDVVYDPNNGRHYVNLDLSKSEAWSAWGCVSISNDDKGNMVVHIEPKKDKDGKYYTEANGSPRVLGGLVLDIDGQTSPRCRVQMNQRAATFKVPIRPKTAKRPTRT